MKQRRVAGLIAALSIVAVACTATSTESRSGASTLAILDQDNAVVIVDQDGDVVERYDPPPDIRYVQPIWASSDVVVHAQAGPGDNRLTATRLGGEEVWSVEFATPPFYYLASPDDGSTRVVSLRSGDIAGGLVAEVVSGSGSVDAAGNESPFYMSWDPTGRRLATHVGGERLDVRDSGVTTVVESTGPYQAPVWLDSGLVTLRRAGTANVLSIWDGSTFADLGVVQGGARFVGAGSNVAIRTGANPNSNGVQAVAQSIPTIPARTLTIVDLNTGSLTTVTSSPSPVYQWDASGSRLLYATIVSDPNPALVWHVWEDEDVIDFEPFAPDPFWFQTFVPFFDQYAQSVSLWSPDGSAFAYPALVEGEPRIFVQQLDEPSPRDIAGGVWVAWAP